MFKEKSFQPKNVKVLNMRGELLQPTTACKARRMIKNKQAVIINKVPLVIQLQIATGEANVKS